MKHKFLPLMFTTAAMLLSSCNFSLSSSSTSNSNSGATSQTTSTSGDSSNSTTQTVEVKLSSITLSGGTRTFEVGDTFSYAGLTVTAHYTNNTAKTVTGYSVSTPNMSSAGTKTVTVTYSEGGVTKTASYSITVVAKNTISEWTLMFYVCGSNLESDNGSAKSDLQEILSVRSQQPSSVKIIVETGGSTSWKMSGVSASKLQRWEINSSCSSSSMSKKQELSNANMGDGSTLQSFLEWGFTNYPAKKYGVFMWNHGGAMDGCCFDDNYEKASNGNGLLPHELSAAVTAARNSKGISSNLEFIAYDACLMAVQDIAEWNSHNFNYMISSQETEWDGGYDYDAWLPTLYANPSTVSTPTVLTKIGETFMDYYDNKGYHDQTQSVLDLSKMDAYKTTWENMTQTLTGTVNSSSKWSTFTTYVNQALKYGYNEECGTSYNNGYPYDVFDINSAMNKLKNGYSSNSTLVSKFSAVQTALNDLVIYKRSGSDSSVKGSCGLNLFCPLSGYNQLEGATWSGKYYPANYDSSCTNFTKWQAFVEQYGNWA